MANAANGTTVTAPNPTPPPATLTTPFANPLEKVLAFTATVQYDLWANVISRLELRWDHAADGCEAFGGAGPLGGAVPDKKNEVMLAANVIYKF